MSENGANGTVSFSAGTGLLPSVRPSSLVVQPSIILLELCRFRRALLLQHLPVSLGLSLRAFECRLGRDALEGARSDRLRAQLLTEDFDRLQLAAAVVRVLPNLPDVRSDRRCRQRLVALEGVLPDGLQLPERRNLLQFRAGCKRAVPENLSSCIGTLSLKPRYYRWMFSLKNNLS